MEVWQIVTICVVAAVIVAAIGFAVYGRKRSEHFRRRYGPEYDRRVSELRGDRRRAESELVKREGRVRSLQHRPLTPIERAKFVEQWRMCQAQFVDEPENAVRCADQLVSDIMHARGYSIEAADDRLADLCAAYPSRASHFREANEVVMLHRRGNASTEDLRKAFVHFRSVFDEMLGGQDEELKRAS